MVASKIHKSTAADFCILIFGINEVMVTSKIQKPAAAAAELWILNFGIKDVLVVNNLDFADWPFPESAAAKLKQSNIWFRGLGIIITASCEI